MTTVPHRSYRWRKSGFSTAEETCVELAYDGAVRDSKNPAGPVLSLPLGGLLAAVKTGAIG